MPCPITTLFLDIGAVLLTNGWDKNSRKRAAETFGLDYDEMSERHHLTFGTFSPEEFKKFMFARSKPSPNMIQLIRGVKTQYGLRIDEPGQ